MEYGHQNRLIMFYILVCVIYLHTETVTVSTISRCRHLHTKINCAFQGFTDVPNDVPADTTELILNDNHINVIYPRQFANLSSLLMLDLHKNWINTIYKGAFQGLHNLEQLYLNANRLQTIPDDVFIDLFSLMSLHLESNPFDVVGKYPSQALNELHSLKTLVIDVFDNNFNYNVSLDKMVSLRKLYAVTYTWSSYEVHNNTFVGFKSLKIFYVDISGPITHLDKDAFQHFKSLRGLSIEKAVMSVGDILTSTFSLQGMTLEYIRIKQSTNDRNTYLDSSAIEYLKHICVKELSIISSGLVSIQPRVILLLRNSCIEALDVSGNALFRPGFLVLLSVLKRLRKFSIAKNTYVLEHGKQRPLKWENSITLDVPKHLEVIDASFSSYSIARRNISLNAPSIRFIDLSHMGDFNNFVKVGGLTNMKIFNISSTKLSHPAMDMLDDMTSLTHFIARNTHLGIGINLNISRFFIGLKSLETLDIGGNILTNLNEPFLDTHKQTIKYLIFNNMHLAYIPTNAVKSLNRLETLDLRSNNIATIDKNGRRFLQDRSSKTSVFLQGNTFQCNCADSSMEFLQWIKSYQHLITDYKTIQCRKEDGTEVSLSNLVMDLRYFELVCKSSFILKVSIAMSVITIFVLIISAFSYKHRYVLSYTLSRMRKRVKGYSDISYMKYDCFLCFSGHDASWVKNILYEQLTEGNQMKICVHDKDFELGADIYDCIYDAMDQSRRILFVITYHFLNSNWGNREMEMAKIHMVTTEQYDKIIVILKDPIDKSSMPKVLRWIWDRNVCLQWPTKEEFPDDNDLEHQEKKLWKRLKKILKPNDSTFNSNIQMD